MLEGLYVLRASLSDKPIAGNTWDDVFESELQAEL